MSLQSSTGANSFVKAAPTPVGDTLRRHVPEDFREGYPEDFMTVLDGVYDFKRDVVRRASRIYCPPLSMNTAYLRKAAQNLGWPTVPDDFSKLVLDAMILNAEGVFSQAGTYQGLDYWLRVLTQGEPVYEGALLPKERYIVLHDSLRGYFSGASNWDGTGFLSLFSGAATDVVAGSLALTIATPYWQLASLKTYIEQTLRQILGFTGDHTVLTVTLTEGPYVVNPYANSYFVNPVV